MEVSTLSSDVYFPKALIGRFAAQKLHQSQQVANLGPFLATGEDGKPRNWR